MLLAVISALGSALLYALASVLQQRAAAAQPREQSMRLGLLTRLMRRPVWLVGIGADGAAYVLQFVALGHGALALVQPLLVSGLLFALPLGAFLARTRMSGRDWSGAIALVVGLSLFLLVSSPGAGHANASNMTWLMLSIICALAIGLIVLAAQGRSSRLRAGLLAAAAGVDYGLTAAYTKSAAHLLLDHGVVAAITSWEAYGLVIAGVLGMLLAQSAFQSGPLDASLPVLTVMDPIVSIVIGAAVLGEGIRTGLGATTLELAGLALMTVGVFVLSRAEDAAVNRQAA
ncbi:MAG TPA: DMT family transporter [Acidimicrobiales bacterium]